MALATLLVLAGCHQAYGGGYLGEPVPGEVVGVYQGEAYFGFNFTCDVNERAKQAEIKGQIVYHDSPSTIDGVEFPEIRLIGIVDPFYVEGVLTCEEAVERLPVARFGGTYRSQDLTPGVPRRAKDGRFRVLVYDQGEPGGSREDITGDGFSIQLTGGPYTGYTRAGYIEGGNIQVE